MDAAQLEAPLAVDQGESSWICAEVAGGGRRFAVLAWVHRTGPRLLRFDAGVGVIDRHHLPAAVRALVPSWLPILTPVKLRTDDRPLLMMVLYDLDEEGARPLVVEHEVEHADFDAASFSASARGLEVRVRDGRLALTARTPAFELRLTGLPSKAPVAFGDGSPLLRHGDMEVGYLQRPRVVFSGEIARNGTRAVVSGEGAHDRHWRWASVRDLAWLWLHLRLEGEREVNAYVITDARRRGHEIARAGWLIDARGSVHVLDRFVLERRGDAYRFEARDLRLGFRHALADPFVPMRAFGEAIDGGIVEGPITTDATGVSGWLEVFDAARCTVR